MHCSLRCVVGVSVLVSLSSSDAAAQPPAVNHFITIKVYSKEDGRPLARAQVQVMGEGVIAVDYPPNGTAVDSTGWRGITTDATGKIVVVLKPGQYRFTIHHEAHKSVIEDVTIPPPGYENTTELEWRARLKMRERLLQRALHVNVKGKRKDVLDRVSVQPLADANVEAFDDAGRLIEGTWTGADGKATITSADLVLGELVRVRVKADGMRALEQTLVVGSQQETVSDPTISTQTSKWDVIRFTLEEDAGQATVRLIVEVADTETDAPIKGAFVTVEKIGGGNLALGETGADGKTQQMALPVGPGGAVQGQVRVKIDHADYEDALSDIPDELLEPSTQPRIYLVHLNDDGGEDATTNPLGMTACEAAVWERFKQFARQKNPDVVLREDANDLMVRWEYRPAEDGNPAATASAGLQFYATIEGQAGQERQWGSASGFGRKPANVAGRTGAVSGGAFWWLSGRFIATCSLGSDLPGYPTDEQARALAVQIAGLVGTCPGGYEPEGDQ